MQYTYTRNQLRELKSVGISNNLYLWSPGAPGTKSYASNGLNQYSTVAGIAQTHDARGNLTADGTWTYSYDAENRLRTAAKAGTTPVNATLAYDPEGRLRQTTIGTSTTRLLYDGQKLVAEYDAAGTLLRRYVHGPGQDEPIVWYEGSTTTNKNWLYRDYLGSIVATANTTGASTGIYTYGPFGEPGGTGPNTLRFRYTGQQYLADLGLYYYKARFYSPATGRFLQTDPIGYADQMNLYAYVGNNAVNRVDPTGLYAQSGSYFASGQANSLGANQQAQALQWEETGPQDESYQVAWTSTVDMVNPKQNRTLEGGGGGFSGGAGLIYRSASGTPASMTPRTIDASGLSAADSFKNALPGKNQVIDTSKFQNLCAVCDNAATGHVSIMPKDPTQMQGWINSRGAAETHPLTIELMNSVVGTVKK